MGEKWKGKRERKGKSRLEEQKERREKVKNR